LAVMRFSQVRHQSTSISSCLAQNSPWLISTASSQIGGRSRSHLRSAGHVTVSQGSRPVRPTDTSPVPGRRSASQPRPTQPRPDAASIPHVTHCPPWESARLRPGHTATLDFRIWLIAKLCCLPEQNTTPSPAPPLTHPSRVTSSLRDRHNACRAFAAATPLSVPRFLSSRAQLLLCPKRPCRAPTAPSLRHPAHLDRTRPP